jgi:site-specific recombinase XerD
MGASTPASRGPAGYSGSTHTSYTTDLRLFALWCREAHVRLLDVKRAHVELFARHMETDGVMRATVARRLSTLAGFDRYCHDEGIVDRNPAANVRSPKVDYESRTLGLDRNELGGLLVQAGLGTARDDALITLLAMNGLRISEALGADIEDLDSDRGHRTLRIVRKASSPSHPGRGEPSICAPGSGPTARSSSTATATAIGWTATQPAGW